MKQLSRSRLNTIVNTAVCLFALQLASISAAVASEDRGLFWRVQSPTATVYLLGSIHYADASFYPLRDTIMAAFDASQALVVEVDINAIDPREYQQLMATKGMYAGNETLRDHVSAKTYTRLQRALEKLGLPIASVEKQKPGMVAMLLTSLLVQRMGYSAELGIDQHFLSAAHDPDKRKQKTILELESFQAQMKLLLDMPKPELLLQSTLDSVEEAEQLVDELITTWKRGNVERMEALLISEALEAYPEFSELYEALFYRRNATMLKKINSYLSTTNKQRNSYFVVVGAGHLMGERGIVQMLEKQGYRTERL